MKKCRICGTEITKENAYPSAWRHRDWVCKKCDAGRLKKYREDNLERCKAIAAKSRKKAKDNHRLFVDLHPHRQWAISTLKDHRRDGIKITITNDELEALAKKASNCSLCGVALYWQPRRVKALDNSPSLDRINNERVITINNIEIVCWSCNRCKRTKTREQFLQYCVSVIEYNERGLGQPLNSSLG